MVKGPSWADKMLMTEDQWQKDVESEGKKWGRTENTEELTDVPTENKMPWKAEDKHRKSRVIIPF